MATSMKPMFRLSTLSGQLLLPIAIGGLCLLGLGLAGVHALYQKHLYEDLHRRAELIATATGSAALNLELRAELQRLVTTLAAEEHVQTIALIGQDPPRVLASNRHDWLGKTPGELPRPGLVEIWEATTGSNEIWRELNFADQVYALFRPKMLILPGREQLEPTAAGVLVEMDARPRHSAYQEHLSMLAITAGGGLVGLIILTAGLIYFRVLRPLDDLRFQLALDPEDHKEVHAFPGMGAEIRQVVEAINHGQRQRRAKTLIARETQQLLELALRSNRQGFLDWDVHEDRLTISADYAKTLGVNAAAYRPSLGELIERIHPDDRAAIDRELAPFMAGNIDEYRVEHRVRVADGSYRWTLAIGKIVERDPTGEPSRVIGTHTDIHESKLRAAELARSEIRWRTIFEGSPVGIAAFDQENKLIVLCNPAMAALFGTTVEEFVHRPIESLHPGRALPRVLESMRKMATGDLSPVIHPCVKNDGTLFYASVTPCALVLDGKATMLAFFNDVTAEYQVKKTLATSQTELLNAQRIARLGSWQFRLEDERFSFSHNLPRLFQMESTEITATRLVEKIFPEDLPLLKNAWQRVKGGETVEVEHRLMLGDQEWWFDTHAEPVRDENNRIIGINGVCRDINPRKTTELALQRSQRLESIGNLAGGIAHDLNNLLTPIIIAVDLIKQQAPAAARTCSLLESSAQKAADIVRQLLTFARGGGSQRGPVQVRHEIKEIERFIKSTFDRSIEIEVHCPRDLPPLLADPTQLHQVLINLAVNARDAMPEGGKLSLMVTIHSAADVPPEGGFGAPRQDIDYLCIEVSDTGTGIAAENIEKVFDPFFSTKTIDKGTGLGLSTALGIVKAHDGFMCVDSTQGEGTRFAIWLPLFPTGKVVKKTVFSGTPEGKGDLVLVADDETAIRDVVKIFLETWGFEVHTAMDGVDALAKLENEAHAYQLVITDINMPRMDGLALIRSIKNSNRAIPILVMTGVADEERLKRIAALGIPHVLQKPFSADKLASLLKDWPNLETPDDQEAKKRDTDRPG